MLHNAGVHLLSDNKIIIAMCNLILSRDVEVKADFAERVVTHVLVELNPDEDVQQVLTVTACSSDL